MDQGFWLFFIFQVIALGAMADRTKDAIDATTAHQADVGKGTQANQKQPPDHMPDHMWSPPRLPGQQKPSPRGFLLVARN